MNRTTLSVIVCLNHSWLHLSPGHRCQSDGWSLGACSVGQKQVCGSTHSQGERITWSLNSVRCGSLNGGHVAIPVAQHHGFRYSAVRDNQTSGLTIHQFHQRHDSVTLIHTMRSSWQIDWRSCLLIPAYSTSMHIHTGSEKMCLVSTDSGKEEWAGYFSG